MVLERAHEVEQAALVMVYTPTKIRIPSSFTHQPRPLLISTAVLTHSRTMTEFADLRAQAIYSKHEGQPNSCNLFIFQTLVGFCTRKHGP